MAITHTPLTQNMSEVERADARSAALAWGQICSLGDQGDAASISWRESAAGGVLWDFGKADPPAARRFALELLGDGSSHNEASRLLAGMAFLGSLAGSDGWIPIDVMIIKERDNPGESTHGSGMENVLVSADAYIPELNAHPTALASAALKAFDCMIQREYHAGGWRHDGGGMSGVDALEDYACDWRMPLADSMDADWTRCGICMERTFEARALREEIAEPKSPSVNAPRI